MNEIRVRCHLAPGGGAHKGEMRSHTEKHLTAPHTRSINVSSDSWVTYPRPQTREGQNQDPFTSWSDQSDLQSPHSSPRAACASRIQWSSSSSSHLLVGPSPAPFKFTQRAFSFWEASLSADNLLAFQYRQRAQMSRRMNRTKGQKNKK